jgi:uncharacterized membrane protein
MFPSLLAAFLFAASGISGRRAAVALGPLRANAWRLVLAAVLLGAWVSVRGSVDFSTRAVQWLLVSGVVGFGLGDMCLFLAYPRLGARLTLLLNLCSAPLFGALLDWVLQRESLSAAQFGASALVLGGVSVALLGGHGGERKWSPEMFGGVIAAVGAGLGQGCGAALSRHAQALAASDGAVLDGITQAFVRTLPGMTLSIIVWQVVARVRRELPAMTVGGRAWQWLAAAVMCGPVLGVSCFQWALGLQSSVVVLSITASAPVLVMPMSAWIDGDRPPKIAVAGAILAVAGVILLLQHERL